MTTLTAQAPMRLTYGVVVLSLRLKQGTYGAYYGVTARLVGNPKMRIWFRRSLHAQGELPVSEGDVLTVRATFRSLSEKGDVAPHSVPLTARTHSASTSQAASPTPWTFATPVSQAERR
jgi:hypothetical protein